MHIAQATLGAHRAQAHTHNTNLTQHNTQPDNTHNITHINNKPITYQHNIYIYNTDNRHTYIHPSNRYTPQTIQTHNTNTYIQHNTHKTNPHNQSTQQHKSN